jgi:hypothetical protein
MDKSHVSIFEDLDESSVRDVSGCWDLIMQHYQIVGSVNVDDSTDGPIFKTTRSTVSWFF